VAKGRRTEAHAGATIQAIHNVAVNRIDTNSGAAAKGLERYTTQQLYGELLARFDEDPTRDGLLKTPERMEKAMTFLTQGYRQHEQEILRSALFDVDYDEMVMVKDIEMFSLCEHHMLPFFGRCHIGYIPGGRVFGVSKLARLVDMYARRLQLQERLTEQISQVVMESIKAKGVGVMIEARHLCMMMRGVEKQNSMMVTSSVLGVFRDSVATREEFLSLIGRRAA
jgi:GTP cyclohydrolase I